jgi:hypothetical protein
LFSSEFLEQKTDWDTGHTHHLLMISRWDTMDISHYFTRLVHQREIVGMMFMLPSLPPPIWLDMPKSSRRPQLGHLLFGSERKSWSTRDYGHFVLNQSVEPTQTSFFF